MNITQKCIVDECTRSKNNNKTDYCGRHNMRFKKYGDPLKTLRSSWIEKPYSPKTERNRIKITSTGERDITYTSWLAMRGRCLYKSNKDYHRYGGRGITICKDWLGKNGYDNFLKDMGTRTKGLTLDRIDNEKGYYKNNCRWASPKTQANNRRKPNRV